MKVPPAGKATLLVTLPLAALAVAALAVAALAVAALAQIAGPPPLKMGLWQTEVTSTVTGMPEMPAGRGPIGRRTVTQGCLTPDTWKKGLEDFNRHQQDTDCKVTNMHEDSSGIALNETCTSEQFTSAVHFELTFDNSEHTHGSATVHMTGPHFPQGMDSHISMTSHYLGASCGDIKPGDSKVIHE
jgi:Protein of unknown function (DUF3617)